MEWCDDDGGVQPCRVRVEEGQGVRCEECVCGGEEEGHFILKEVCSQ